jgi:NAD(P)-dependent dehydrogenase (short-subunit alcohol dehydrogenase family)
MHDPILLVFIDISFWLVKAMALDLLSLDSVARFAEAWNARAAPLHVLINNAGIFSIGGWYF